jgi:hypothetical protein
MSIATRVGTARRRAFDWLHAQAVKNQSARSSQENQQSKKAYQREDADFSPTFPTGALILEFCRRKLNPFKGR